jgi:hypothetical protein
LEASLGRIVLAHETCAVALLGHQLHRWLKESDIPAGSAIEFGELAIGQLALKAVRTNDLAHNRTIFLFDIALVVLVCGSPTGKSDLRLLTIHKQLGIDKRFAVVGITSEQGKGQELACPFKCLQYSMLSALQERLAFGPSSGDVGDHQRLEEGAFAAPATVRDQISFTEARRGFIPIVEGPNRDLVFQEGTALGGGLATWTITLAYGT